jgi:hypothetical protein
LAQTYTAIDRSANGPAQSVPVAHAESLQHQPTQLAPVDALLRLIGQIQQVLPVSSKPLQAQTISSLLRLILGVSSPQTAQPAVAQTLNQLLKLVKQEPDAMQQLIQRALNAHGAARAATPQPDPPLTEWSNLLRVELLQQSEQSLSQLLTLQTAGRLQAEQNQPLQLQMLVPLVIDQTTHQLKLSLRQQRPRDEGEFAEGWDIQLSFEFGLLGVITTHISLRDEKLAADFWTTSSATRDLIDSNLQRFRQQLKHRGFNPGELGAHLGHPPQADTKPDHTDTVAENLLDIQA